MRARGINAMKIISASKSSHACSQNYEIPLNSPTRNPEEPNQLHWTLDVTFQEDQSRARSGHAPENLSTLRCLALNLLKQNKSSKSSLRSKRKIAAWNENFVLQVIFGQQIEEVKMR